MLQHILLCCPKLGRLSCNEHKSTYILYTYSHLQNIIPAPESNNNNNINCADAQGIGNLCLRFAPHTFKITDCENKFVMGY